MAVVDRRTAFRTRSVHALLIPPRCDSLGMVAACQQPDHTVPMNDGPGGTQLTKPGNAVTTRFDREPSARAVKSVLALITDDHRQLRLARTRAAYGRSTASSDSARQIGGYRRGPSCGPAIWGNRSTASQNCSAEQFGARPPPHFCRPEPALSARMVVIGSSSCVQCLTGRLWVGWCEGRSHASSRQVVCALHRPSVRTASVLWRSDIGRPRRVSVVLPG